MFTQSNNATLGHAEGVNPLSASARVFITDFQMNLVVAQLTRQRCRRAQRCRARPVARRRCARNRRSSGSTTRTAATRSGLRSTRTHDDFNAWAGLSGTAQNDRRASIARGQAIFNTKLIRIAGVRGVNDALGVATCSTAPARHAIPIRTWGTTRTSSRSISASSSAAEGDNVLPVFRVTKRAHGSGGRGHRSRPRYHHRSLRRSRQDERARPFARCPLARRISQRRGRQPHRGDPVLRPAASASACRPRKPRTFAAFPRGALVFVRKSLLS